MAAKGYNRNIRINAGNEVGMRGVEWRDGGEHEDGGAVTRRASQPAILPA